tara:strand:- start:16 stop:270 length:255 start_codon:yes stop_codon:yes gene_type:complete
MSVTPETHQSAMGPYFAVAAASFESNSVTAVFKSALSAKQPGDKGGKDGGEGAGGGGLGEGGPRTLTWLSAGELSPQATKLTRM